MQHELYRKNKANQTLNRVMQINLLLLFLHCLHYGPLPDLLLGLHNPFATAVIAMAFAALIGLWLCMDYMLPVWIEARINHEPFISKPAGWMLLMNVVALGGTSYHWVATDALAVI